MIDDFNEYLVSVCKAAHADRFLLAVSGGVDSVVMAHLFKAGGKDFAIAHCNFQLRGEESQMDQDFVAALARDLQVPFFVTSFDTGDYAASHGISVQMAARDLRYDWFEEISTKQKFNHIAIAHNKNDAVETMFLNLSRGTGIRGLMGIRPVLKKIIRPLLFASRTAIMQYAETHSLKWREDSSNLETKYQRNKIRHTIIPAFESINPSFIQNAADTIKRIEQTGQLLNILLGQIKKELWTESPDSIKINIRKLKEYPANDLLLFELLRDFGISQLSEQMILNSLESVTGKQFHTRTHTFTHDRDYLIVTPKSTTDPCETVIEADTILLNYPLRLFFTTIENTAGFKIPRQKNKVALDAGKITFPLVLRVWKPGDRFYPLGLQGSKKISDFLIDIKVPLPDKRHIWILECQGEIAWVVNHRIDDRFKVSEETRKILIIDYRE